MVGSTWRGQHRVPVDPRAMPHLLALSHSGVLGVNRGLYRAIARTSDLRVTLVVPARWRGDLIEDLAFAPEPDDAGIRVVPLGVRRSGRGSLFAYRTTGALARLAAEEKPDVVWIDEEPWSLAASQAARAVRDVPLCFVTKENLRRRYPWPFRRLERRFLARARLAFVSSEEARAVLTGWKAYGGPTALLPFPYDPARFRPLGAAERDAVRARLGYAADRFVVGYAGRLVPEKGIDDLVALIARSTQDPAWRHVDYSIFGSGPSRATLVNAAAAAPPGRVRLEDAVPHGEFGRVLAAMDLLVVPSRTTPRWKEQFGRVLTEAMACEVAVVGSDSGEIPHLIERTGGGLVFRERDADDLYGRVRSLVLDPMRARELGRIGARHVAAHYTNDVVARRLVADLRAHGLC